MATRTPKFADAIDMSSAGAEAVDTAPAVADAGRVQLKMREFINRVVERTGAKKNDAKTISEAVLTILGTALVEGEDLNLPPLGKVMVKREHEDEKARIFTVKVRQVKNKA